MYLSFFKTKLPCQKYCDVPHVQAFLDQVEAGGNVDKNIIGQFGVGFYSTFMVGDKVQVFTKSYKEDSKALCWTSDG